MTENQDQLSTPQNVGERKRYRQYDEQFKREAVSLLATSGRSASSVARSLGIHSNLLHTWRKQYGSKQAAKAQASAPAAMPSLVEMELRKKLREAEMERDILKKAISVFSRPQP